MSNVYIETYGNGSCTVDNYTPENGDIITISAIPDSGAELLDMYCESEHGYSIAIATAQVQRLTYDSTWGDITIYATFSRDVIVIDPPENGSAYVDNYNPTDGQTVTLTSDPDDKYSVSLIICTNLEGTVLWTTTDQVYQFVYHEGWGDINIYIAFDLKWIFKNIWILFTRQWWRKNNF